VQDFKGISFYDAVKEVCGAKVDPRQFLRKEKEEEKPEDEGPEEVILELPEGAKPFGKGEETKAHEIALNYLNSRCITIEEATRYFVHYDSTSIIFPYIEFGMVVYWMRRSLVGKEFLYPPDSVGVLKTEFLYNFDHVEPNTPLIMMEAIIDAISVGHGAVAYGGANIDQKQVRKARMLNPAYVVLAGDNDEPDRHGIRPGIEAIWYNYEMVRPYFQVYFAIPDNPHKDWNDVKVAGLDPGEMIKNNMQLATLTSLISLRNSK
jgi:DNA primase